MEISILCLCHATQIVNADIKQVFQDVKKERLVIVKEKENDLVLSRVTNNLVTPTSTYGRTVQTTMYYW